MPAPCRDAANKDVLPFTVVVLSGFGPVHDVPKGFEIISAAVLVLQVIGMFPNVAAEHRYAFGAADCLTHQWVVLVGRGDDLQFPLVRNQPGPAAAEAADA